MATLQYRMTIIDRPGSSPDCDHWTFHHVLAWRYYYFAAHTLVMMARYLLSVDPDYERSMSRHRLHPAVKGDAELLRDSQFVRNLFGSDSAGFADGYDFQPLEVLKTVLAMSVDENQTINATNETGHLNPEVMATLCANPRFGGFAGMAPDQRLDDPGEECERQRPFSSNVAWWGLLQSLRAVLKGFAPEIASLPNDRSISVKVTREAWSVLLPTIQKLTKDHNRRVHSFTPTDWDYRTYSGSTKVAWVYHPVLPTGRTAGSHTADVFMLNNNGAGDTPDNPTQVPVDMTRDGNRLRFIQ